MHWRHPSRRLLLLLVSLSVAFPAPAEAIESARRSSPHGAPVGALGFTFQATGYTLRTLAPSAWPYATTATVPLEDTGLHDEFGVRMVAVDGVVYNHPVAQAQYAIALISSFQNSGDSTYLARAEAQAQRLLDTSVLARDARYYPYPFDFALHGNTATMVYAPWYSAMAQGQALTVFVRLFELTANQAYWTAAVETFQSFRNLRTSGEPWTVFVDTAGYLWFEEYASDAPDRTYNGLTFAIYGLWEYHRVTADGDALQLIRGGLTTVARYFPSIRVANWVSKYCVSHGIQSATYHQLHIDQLLKLYTMTGAVELARDADLLYVDYPRPSLIATLTFVAGTHTGYRFNWSTGAIIGSKTATLSRSSSAPVATRERIKGRAGYWFRITAGIWAGYWIPETPGRSYVAGQLALVQAYDPPRTVTFAAGTYVGYVFNAGGAVTKSKVASLSRTSTASADQRVVINGRGYLRITNGIWAGMFVPLGTGISY